MIEYADLLIINQRICFAFDEESVVINKNNLLSALSG